MAAKKATSKKKPQIPFAYKLVLNQWLLSLFGVTRFDELAEHLRNEKLEGLDENNIHHFHHALTAQLFNLTHLPTELLLEYDQNIVKHTQRLNDRRVTVGETTDRLEVFPIPDPAFYRDLSRPLFQRRNGTVENAKRPGRRNEFRPARSRADYHRLTSRLRHGLSSTNLRTGAPPAAARRC